MTFFATCPPDRHACQGYRNYEQSPVVQLDSVTIAKTLPLRALSRLWGAIANMTVPREYRLQLWSWVDRVMECHLDEVEQVSLDCMQWLIDSMR